MAEHSIKLGHHIQVQDMSILAMKSGYKEHIREVTEIELHSNNNNMNREEVFSPSNTWKLLL
jgi:hypothetical protein